MNTATEPKAVEPRLCSSVEWAAVTARLLERGAVVRLRVLGSSMLPAIRNGDWIQVAPLAGDPILAGTIVLYARRDGTPIIHRALSSRTAAEGSEWYIVSDSVPSAGEWVPKDRIHGTVLSLEREGAYVDLRGWRGRLYGRAVLLSWQSLQIARHIAGFEWMYRAFRRLAYALCLGRFSRCVVDHSRCSPL